MLVQPLGQQPAYSTCMTTIPSLLETKQTQDSMYKEQLSADLSVCNPGGCKTCDK